MDDDLRAKLDAYILNEVATQCQYMADVELDDDLVESFCNAVAESVAVGIIAEQIARDLFKEV